MAVYTKLTNDQIQTFIANYAIGELESATPIQKGIENSNYLIICNGTKYILTIFENRVENADLPFFIRLTDHLRAKGINCPVNIPDKNGNQLNEILGKKASVISFLEGQDVEVVEDFHLEKLGAQLAKMHIAVADFKEVRQNKFALSKWVSLLEHVGGRADELSPNLTPRIAAEIEFLAANWPFGLPIGVVHTDLFPDNVFFSNGEVSGVIDFYFSCTDSFAYDIAICLNAWGAVGNSKRTKLFLDSYESIRKLSAEELAALPVLQRGAAIRFLMTRLYDWFNTPETALVKKKDPLEYLQKLDVLSA